VGLNVSLALVQLVINAMILVGTYLAHGNSRFSGYAYYVMLLAPLIILLIFGDQLQRMLFCGIVALESTIASLCKA
jgi:hypothetical protein